MVLLQVLVIFAPVVQTEPHGGHSGIKERLEQKVSVGFSGPLKEAGACRRG